MRVLSIQALDVCSWKYTESASADDPALKCLLGTAAVAFTPVAFSSDFIDQSMAQAARRAIGGKKLKAIADRGYDSGTQIRARDDADIAVILPKVTTSSAKAHGHFDRAEFIYIARDDEYLCPVGQRVIYHFTGLEHGMYLRRYWSSACIGCAVKPRCTPSDYRRITRWEHESVLEAAQRRLDRVPEAMTVRRRTVEHVFGALKHWMSYTPHIS